MVDEAVPVIQIKHEVAREAGMAERKLQLRAGSEKLKNEMLRDYGRRRQAKECFFFCFCFLSGVTSSNFESQCVFIYII